MLLQVTYTCIFYFTVIGLFRIAGKRLAGQVTTFDLMILIAFIVALEEALVLEGRTNKFIFVGVGFSLHLLVSKLCSKWSSLRHLLRGRPARLVINGEINFANLRAEGLSTEELIAGLRKVGIESVKDAKTAFLEETGQISAVSGNSEL